jgi:hypothetical protein
MNTAKDEVRSLLDKLPEDCSLEDVQYHLYVIEKIKLDAFARKQKERMAKQKAPNARRAIVEE